MECRGRRLTLLRIAVRRAAFGNISLRRGPCVKMWGRQ